MRKIPRKVTAKPIILAAKGVTFPGNCHQQGLACVSRATQMTSTGGKFSHRNVSSSKSSEFQSRRLPRYDCIKCLSKRDSYMLSCIIIAHPPVTVSFTAVQSLLRVGL